MTSLIFVFLKCSSEKKIETFYLENDKAIHLSEANKETMESLKLKKLDIAGLFTDILVVDSFLLCGNLRSPKLVNIYSLNTGQLLSEVFERGTSKNQGLSVASFYSAGDELMVWVYDITLGKLFKMNVQNAVKDSVYVPEKEFQLTGELKNIFSPSVINDSTILATTYSLDDCRFLYTDSKSILKKIGKLPVVQNRELLKDRPGTKFPNKAYIFKSRIIKHPSENKVAVFYNKTDRAEFYINDTLHKIIKGSLKAAGIKMAVSRFPDGFILNDFEKIKYAYTSVTTTSNSIYCLYGGEKDGQSCSAKVVVFNWNGEIRKSLELDKSVCSIYIDEKSNILYCYDNAEKSIFYATLN